MKYSSRAPLAFTFICIGFLGLTNATLNGTVVHGGWSKPSVVGMPCTKTCGGGVVKKYRSCTKPAPENGGLPCLDDNHLPKLFEEKFWPCNEESCWSFNKVWLDWGPCSTVCGKGNKTRLPDCTTGCGATVPDPETVECNTWNRTTCPNPCDNKKCMSFGICEDISDDIGPKTQCACVLGHIMSDDKKQCKRPPPTTPTERPIPTLPAEQKTVATVISKTASSVLIFFVTLTLILFLFMKIFTVDRVIQMNMEIALLAAHLTLLFPPSMTEQEVICKIISICLHYFFLTCFMFMFLEAVHMYTLIAYVVKKDGYFTRIQNIIVGWAVPAAIVGISVAFCWDDYGAEYHCWLQLNKNVMIAQQVPIIGLMIATFSLIEAAGEADYKPLKGMDRKQITSAKFSQRTNLIIVPFVYAHWVLGTLSEYQQNMALYGIFSIVNGWLGAAVFFLHCSNNRQIREKMKEMYKKIRSDQ